MSILTWKIYQVKSNNDVCTIRAPTDEDAILFGKMHGFFNIELTDEDGKVLYSAPDFQWKGRDISQPHFLREEGFWEKHKEMMSNIYKTFSSVPMEYRNGYDLFLEFKTDADKELFMRGIEVMYGRFVTPEYTFAEMERMKSLWMMAAGYSGVSS